MSATIPPATLSAVIYPDSDGQPIADNTLQFRWIVTIQGGFATLYRERPDVFVAGDLLWYPVEGNPKLRQAPDVLIAFGRPKGERGSYKQWEEGGIAPQVVFEVLSPGNTAAEMVRKHGFYERYGVEEYYVYDPDHGVLAGYLRLNGRLEEIDDIEGWISPRTKVTFLLNGRDLVLYGPDDRYFASYEEVAAQRVAAELNAANERKQRIEAESARQQAEARAERMAAQLRALGIDPDTVG